MLILTYLLDEKVPTIRFSPTCQKLYVINAQAVRDGVIVSNTNTHTQLHMLEHWLANKIPASHIGLENVNTLPIAQNGTVSLSRRDAFQFMVNKKFDENGMVQVDYVPGKFRNGNLRQEHFAWERLLEEIDREGLGKVSHPNLFGAMARAL